jgi:DNA-binding transcriptional MocR family regulator
MTFQQCDRAVIRWSLHQDRAPRTENHTEQIHETQTAIANQDLIGIHAVLCGQQFTQGIEAVSRAIPHGLEPDGVNLEAFEAAVKLHKPKLAYLIADFQNPSGACMSLAKRKKVLELADQYDFMILEDSPYRVLRYKGVDVPSLFELNPARVMQMSSYTKQISPGVRVGTLVGDKAWLAKLAKTANDTYISGAFLGQATVYEFLRRGLLAAQLERLRALYGPRLERMAAQLRANGLNDFLEPEGGFFLSVNLPEGSSMADLLERGKSVGLALTDGRGFFVNPKDGERFLRLPFCALSNEEIDEGMARVAKLVLS